MLSNFKLEVRFELLFDRAIMMGLMLHTNAKQLIKAQNYQDALEVLTMGEVSFRGHFATYSFDCIEHVTWLVIAALNMFPVIKNAA